MAAGMLYDEPPAEKLAVRKRVAKKVIAAVAEALANTSTVSRKYYIHPGLLDSYLDGTLSANFGRFRPSPKRSLSRDEHLLDRFLQRWATS
jgi:DNA topoisomerase-1